MSATVKTNWVLRVLTALFLGLAMAFLSAWDSLLCTSKLNTKNLLVEFETSTQFFERGRRPACGGISASCLGNLSNPVHESRPP